MTGPIRHLFISAAVLAVAAALPLASHATTVIYNGFSSTSGLTFVGTAAPTTTAADGTVARIVAATGSQSGAFYSTTPITLGANDTFSATFQFRFTNPGGIDPADGIAFVLASSPTGLGSNGQGLGYAGVGNSFAVEFDTFENGGNDINSNHVALDSEGVLTNTDLTSPYGVQFCTGTPPAGSGCMSDGDLWNVSIGYNGSQLTVKVTDPGVAGGVQEVIDVSGLNIGSIIGTNTAYVGISGSTGAGFENEDIKTFAFSNTTALANGGNGVPEPAAWALMLMGFGGMGGMLRAARRRNALCVI